MPFIDDISDARISNTYTMPFGAHITHTGNVLFQIVAPSARHVDLLLNKSEIIALEKTFENRFVISTNLASEGTLYQYIVDKKIIVPDPASRYQPEGVHGLSQVVDPCSYNWQDNKWQNRPWREAIIYELHIGTFTPQGTFLAAIDKLDDLVALGITAIEIMPVADFPGERNWGYDGVLLFAPAHSYGKPDDLKALIDNCHKKGLMVILDVVYNHFGPEGNYLHTYAKEFFTDRYKTPWGEAINFDGSGCDIVRQFFVHNALYWIEEYHFDGLRLDAVHAIYDSSAKHIVIEICEKLRTNSQQKSVHIILENDNNNTKFLTISPSNKPLCASAQWNDDIHHVFHRIATGEDEGYYSDYHNPISGLAKSLTEGFIFQGEVSHVHGNKKRGEPSKDLPPTSFISFLQNHDQIGNRAFGERLIKLAHPDQLKLLVSILLLSPQIPMLFMGEEWAASTPFFYFCDLGPELAPLVVAGRQNEFRHFKSFQDPKKLKTIPDPCAEETFNGSKLNWQERTDPTHSHWLALYSKLIHLRKKYIIPILTHCDSRKHKAISFHPSAFYIRWALANDLYLLANLADTEVECSRLKDDLQRTTCIFQHPGNIYKSIECNTLPAHSILWCIGDET